MNRAIEEIKEEIETNEENGSVVSFYQNRAGELCALAEVVRDGEHVYRLIENIEKMKFTSENIEEQARRGFDDFSEYNPYDFGGISFGEIALEITEGEDFKLVAEFADNISGFVPENMDRLAVELFAPLMEGYANKPAAPVRPTSVHEEQLCFFAA